ncbi:MAG: DUF2946 family protein [Sphingomonas sp.]|jgi:hypothetical protein
MRTLPRYASFALITVAMLLRLVIPAGYMPTTDATGAIRISVCTGTGAQTAYVDRDGKVHKEAPDGKHQDPQPCGFGALSVGLATTLVATLVLPSVVANLAIIAAHAAPSVGKGLAAPPPPSTGPPSLI